MLFYRCVVPAVDIGMDQEPGFAFVQPLLPVVLARYHVTVDKARLARVRLGIDDNIYPDELALVLDHVDHRGERQLDNPQAPSRWRERAHVDHPPFNYLNPTDCCLKCMREVVVERTTKA
jgi:hypothetical protein